MLRMSITGRSSGDEFIASRLSCTCTSSSQLVGGPERVIRGEDAVVAVAVLPRRRHEIGQAIEKLPRRKVDEAVLTRGGGLALPAGADPLPALVAGQRGADAFGGAVAAGSQGESLECEGGPGAVSQEVLDTPEVARHVAVHEGDADAGIDGEAGGSQNLKNLPRTLDRLDKLAPNHRKHLGCYRWDYANKAAMPVERMKHQCQQGLR
jgi:hypothetical protein